MSADESPSGLIDAKIAGLRDWRGVTLRRLRALIREADPAMAKAVKWRDVWLDRDDRTSASHP